MTGKKRAIKCCPQCKRAEITWVHRDKLYHCRDCGKTFTKSAVATKFAKYKGSQPKYLNLKVI